MAYHFPLMPRFYMAIAQEDRFPVTDILRQTPDIPADCQWALFLRNHDELTLEMVTDVERDYLWSTYANDPRARINVGIRRRLAPLMDNDRRKIELMNSLLLSFPGTPIIYYGDEIGMGDNIYLGDRNGVRTPMQWAPDRNGGFSRADPARLYAPLIMDPLYGYESVNVEAQSRSLSSLLNWTKRMISVRKTSKAFGRGTITFIRPTNRSVLAYVRQYGDDVILCVANLSRSAQATELALAPWKDRVPLEMLGRTSFPRIGELPYLVTLSPYGFYWFKLQEKPTEKPGHDEFFAEFETLVVPAGSTWVTLERTRGIFERDVLPIFLAKARWFPHHTATGIITKVTSAIPFTNEGTAVDNESTSRSWLAIFESIHHGEIQRFALPMRVDWVRFDRERYNPKALAAVRQAAREGTLFDVATDKDFVKLVLDNVRNARTTTNGTDLLVFQPTEKFREFADHPIHDVHAVNAEQSNSTSIVDETMVVKIYRRLEAGTNPEIEMGRFLTDVVSFPNVPDLLGSVELVEGETHTAIAIVHRFVPNQGDAWSLTVNYLDRFIEQRRLLAATETSQENPEQVSYLPYMIQAGRRIAEMQMALASRDDLPDFAPEPVTHDDVQAWIDRFVSGTEAVFERLGQYRASVKDWDRELIDALSHYRNTLPDLVRMLLAKAEGVLKARHHGDLHLGQLLVAKDDILIIDFEGEPRRHMKDRRSKTPAARDVAGLLRSIDYSGGAALLRALAAGPDESGSLTDDLEQWRQISRDTFMTAYRESMTDTRLWPADPAEAQNLLRFFLLEKVFYEIDYELAHRPDWLNVPLRGALRILKNQKETAS
jgi:maltose alpha-D-glucosyltransferase / alpha-amylase